jgi:hypothetical protein
MKLYLSLSHIILVASTSWYTASDAASSTATSSGGSIRGNSSKDGDRKLSLFADYTPHKKRSIERDADNGESDSMNVDTIVPSTAAGLMETRIIGGSQTQNGRYSYAVSLQDSLGHFCGGSLIAKDVVLTAAHCQGGSYNVVVGRHDLTTNSGESIPVKKEIPHPKYNDRTTDSDWNIVILSRPTTENVDLVQINASGNSPSTGQDVTVMGWGDTIAADDAQKLSDVLMAVDVNVISNSDCDDSSGTINGWSDSYKGQITSNMLCAADKFQDSCQGDSGGPLIIPGNGASSDVQVGVVSWGIGCASANFPGVYARVSEAYDWIKQTVCSESSDPPAALCGGSGNNPTPTPPSPTPPASTSYPTSTMGNGNDDVDQSSGSYPTHFPSNMGGGTDMPYNDDVPLDDGMPYDDVVPLDDTTQANQFSNSPGTVYDDVATDDVATDDVATDDAATDDAATDDATVFPTFSPTTTTGSSGSGSGGGTGTSSGNWVTIIEDDFKSGFGFMNSGGADAKYLDNKKDRDGVLDIQDNNGDESSVHSNPIITDTAYSSFRVVFSVYMLGMEEDDKFCFDYSADGGITWTEQQCWKSPDDFTAKSWYDDVSTEFQVNTSSLAIRFRCVGTTGDNKDDVLIDKISVQGSN